MNEWTVPRMRRELRDTENRESFNRMQKKKNTMNLREREGDLPLFLVFYFCAERPGYK